MKWPAFWVAAFSAFMATLDSSIVNLALPTLSDEFNTDVSLVSWVVQSYLLVTMAFLLVGGRLLNLWGARKLFVLGFALFTVGSGVCALSLSVYMLIMARAFQGLGAAVLMSANQGLIALSFPPEQRGRALGMIGTVVSIGLASGPPLGGWLIEILGWRAIFYINVPIGALAILYCQRHLSPKAADLEKPGFDLPGAVLIVIGLSSLFLGLDRGAALGWDHPLVIVLLFTSLIMLVWLIANERRSHFPLLNLSLFRSRYFTQSCAAAFLAFFSMISATILLPFLLQEVWLFTPALLGLIMMTLPLAMLVIAPLGGLLSDFIGTRIPASFGLVLVGAGLLVLSGLEEEASLLGAVLGLGIIGVGMGFFGSPNSSAILSGVPEAHVGEASGLSALMRTSGIAFGIAFSVTAFTWFSTHGDRTFSGRDDLEPSAYVDGIVPVFLLAAVLVGLNVLNSLTRGRDPRRKA
ncbi:MAG: DHA2 family efflux MFS transporter permease subunit [Planctomycetota bacterium]